ncbi:MAG: hypothetical protein WC699_06950 [Bacteroidales bacterium]|jgi:glycosyltransferase involved in cell wall biosynthesis
MMLSKRALVMVYNDPGSDPRPRRTVRLLNELHYRVDVLTYGHKASRTVNKAYIIPSNGRRKKYARVMWFFLNKCIRIYEFAGLYLGIEMDKLYVNRFNLKRICCDLKANSYSLIVVEDLDLLPVANFIRHLGNIVFDAREYYPKQNEENRWFRFVEAKRRNALLRRYLPVCDEFITVSPGLANAYAKEFGANPQVILSTPDYREVKIKPAETNMIKLVHHGIANRNRRLGNMIEIVKRLDNRYSLDFYLTGSVKYIEELKDAAKGHDCIIFNDPVEFDMIIPTLSNYDIGFYFLEPIGFNVTYNLPNKIFEFIQSRLAVVIGPSPNMAEIVSKYSCGFISNEFSIDSMVDTLDKLTLEDINTAKRNSDRAAKELCFEEESKKYRRLLETLV